MKPKSITISAFSESVILIQTENRIDETISTWIHALHQAIDAKQWNGVIEALPAYASLAVFYNPLLISFNQIHDKLDKLTKTLNINTPKNEDLAIELPVCYAPSFAPDQEKIMAHTGLSWPTIIELHSSATYTVFQLGFMPGFPFLGGLHPHLHCPRKAQPALRLEPGSVGIGGQQTGIYSLASPGGWNIIGRCPIPLFQAHKENPFLLKPRSKVIFKPISETEFYNLHKTAYGS